MFWKNKIEQVGINDTSVFIGTAVAQQTQKHLFNICTTSAQRLRRWSNIVQIFGVCWVAYRQASLGWCMVLGVL